MNNDYSLNPHGSGISTYGELGGSCRSSVKTEHYNLQAVTAVGAFEEAWVHQVRGHSRRQVDPPVCQAVTVKRKGQKVMSASTKGVRTCEGCPIIN